MFWIGLVIGIGIASIFWLFHYTSTTIRIRPKSVEQRLYRILAKETLPNGEIAYTFEADYQNFQLVTEDAELYELGDFLLDRRRG